MGRPPIPASERKGINLTFRARGDLREWLGTVAALSNRSISEEIERILEAHRRDQDVVLEALGGKDASEVVRPLLSFLAQLGLDGIVWKGIPKVEAIVQKGAHLITDAAISKRVVSKEEYLQFMSDSRGDGEENNTIFQILARAIFALQLFGLAEKITEGEYSYSRLLGLTANVGEKPSDE
jgi:hypothetical protein